MIWAGAEIAVTMVCIGMAVCLPLYRRIYERIRAGRHQRLPDHHLHHLSDTLPDSGLAGCNNASLGKSNERDEYSQMRRVGIATSAPADCHDESANIRFDVWGLKDFQDPFEPSTTTCVTGGLSRDGREGRRGLLLSMTRDVPGVAAQGVTDEEAQSGVMVTTHIDISSTQPEEI